MNSQKGITLFLTVAVMTIFLAVGLALNAMLMNQLKMKGGIGNSLTAFLAADTGLEDELFFYSIGTLKGTGNPRTYSDNVSNASYSVVIKTAGDLSDPPCSAASIYDCIFSTGKFSESQRRVSMRR